MPTRLAKKYATVKVSDLKRYRTEVVSLRAKLEAAIPSAGCDPAEKAIWEVYAGTENLVAVLKSRLDYETPGVFIKLPKPTNSGLLLREASESLSMAAEMVSTGKLVESIETLRTARNNLRSYLAERRRAATRPTKNSPAESTD